MNYIFLCAVLPSGVINPSAICKGNVTPTAATLSPKLMAAALKPAMDNLNNLK